MLKGKTLKNFCLLTLKVGVNLQKGQGLEIYCPVEKREIAKELALCAYSLGAKKVNVRWEDEDIDRITYTYADTKTLTDIPKWYVDSKNYLVKENYCYVAISAEDPEAFKLISPEKLATVAKAKSKRLKRYSDAVMSNAIRWCVISVPTKCWAKKVFKGDKNAQSKLSTAIEKSMRLDKEDPVKEWQKHVELLEKRAKFLNDNCFASLLFTASNGTNLTVGLAQNHVWLSAKERAKDGLEFIANMPTEEIFTAPHKDRVDGIVYSAMPLCFNGNIIDNFYLEFKNGKVISFDAEKGYDTLKGIIETDGGTRRIGEVALIDKNSPIASMNTLFFNTLFDENASCHLALGKAYPTTLLDGDKLTKKQLSQLGANDSSEHVDFMIGTPDVNVYGITKDNDKTPIIVNGEFII